MGVKTLRQLCINAIVEILLAGRINLNRLPKDVKPDIGEQLLIARKVVNPERVTIAKRSSTDKPIEYRTSSCGRLNVKSWDLQEKYKIGVIVNDSDPVKVKICKKLIDNSPYVDSLFIAKQTVVGKVMSELNIIARGHKS